MPGAPPSRSAADGPDSGSFDLSSSGPKDLPREEVDETSDGRIVEDQGSRQRPFQADLKPVLQLDTHERVDPQVAQAAVRIQREGGVEPQHLAYLLANVGLEQFAPLRDPHPAQAGKQARLWPAWTAWPSGTPVPPSTRRRSGADPRPGAGAGTEPVDRNHAGLDRAVAEQTLQGGEALPRAENADAGGSPAGRHPPVRGERRSPDQAPQSMLKAGRPRRPRR